MTDPVMTGVEVPGALEQVEQRVTATAPDALKLRPYEPDLRAIDALSRMLQAAASPEEWDQVRQALAPVFGQPAPTKSDLALARAGEALNAMLAPDSFMSVSVPRLALAGELVHELVEAVPTPSWSWSDPRVAFGGGLVTGAVRGVVGELEQQVTLVAGLVDALCDYYAAVYDLDVLAGVIAVWLDNPGGTALDDLASVLQNDHPALWSLLNRAGPVINQLNQLTQWFQQAHADDVLRAIADWLYALPEHIGGQIRPTLSEIVQAAGDAKRQGEIIGKAVGPLILQAVTAAVGIADVAVNALRFAVKEGPLLLAQAGDLAQAAIDAMRHATSTAFGGDQTLAAAMAVIGKQAPGLIEAGTATAESTLRQLTREWGAFRIRIEPYRYNSDATQRWGKCVRKFTGLKVTDREYALSIRLDSQHIVGAKWYREFPDQFKNIFTNWAVYDAEGNPVIRKGQQLVVTWSSFKDMDALALHTEAHIRSPEKMAKLLQFLGLEGYGPLDTEMDAFFKTLDRAKDGVGWPFQSAEECIRGTKLYYQREQTHSLWPRVQKWFERAEEAIERSKKP